jgi:tape measure domain-containing protein
MQNATPENWSDYGHQEGKAMGAKDVEAGKAHVLVSIRDRFTKGLKVAENRLKEFGAHVATSAGAVAVGAAGALAWPLKLAADMETTSTAFETILKSGDATKALMTELNQFAESTPFQFPEIAEAAKKLLAFGSNADSVTGELRMLGDIAAGVGVPLGDIAEIYGKARVQGRLFAEDINQLTGRGINVNKELAKQFGVQESEIRKLVEQGKVGFPQLEAAFRSMTTGSGDFAGGMEKQSQTFNGLMSTLIDNVSAVARAIGEELLPFFKDLATVGIEVAKGIGEFVANNKEAVATVGKFVLIAGGIAGLLAGIGTAAMATSIAIAGMTSAVTALSIAAGALSVVFSPIGLAVGLFAAAGVAAWTFRDDLWAVMQEIRAIWGEGIDYLSKTWKEMILGIKPSVGSKIDSTAKKATVNVSQEAKKHAEAAVEKAAPSDLQANSTNALSETEEERQRREMEEAAVAAEDALLSLAAQADQFKKKQRDFLTRDPVNGSKNGSEVSRVAGAFTAAAAVALGGKRNDAADKTATNTARLVIIAEKQLMKKGGAFT